MDSSAMKQNIDETTLRYQGLEWVQQEIPNWLAEDSATVSAQQLIDSTAHIEIQGSTSASLQPWAAFFFESISPGVIQALDVLAVREIHWSWGGNFSRQFDEAMSVRSLGNLLRFCGPPTNLPPHFPRTLLIARKICKTRLKHFLLCIEIRIQRLRFWNCRPFS
jgi:hypothetical protein